MKSTHHVHHAAIHESAATILVVVVQVLRWARSEEPVAVKCFLSQAAYMYTYDTGMKQYAEDCHRSMMPASRDTSTAVL